ncbi:MAG TPA: hypothetical protein VN026_11505 [Bacteroidia bacterium]|jgi:hypothetical protein|nr:hypothetical protein [Bacteroidia bacterium]
MNKYKIVKYQLSGNWKYAIQKKHWLFGWKYLTQYGNGDIYDNVSSSSFSTVKIFDTEKEAEDTINNLLYSKTI